MLNKNKVSYRQNTYNTSDSGIMFLLALIIPQFLMLLVMLICSSATGLPFSSADETPSFISTYPVLYGVLCGVIPQISMIVGFVFVSERKKVNYAKANQISFKNFNWLVMLIVIAVGVVCLFGFTPFVNWFDHIVEGWGYSSATSSIDVSTVGKFVGSIFYIGFLPAICEELVFRGVITNGLKENGTKTAVIFSAVLFALMHQNLQQFVYQLFLGGVMAYILLKTGNILYTMLLHFFNNFVVLLDSHLSTSSSADMSIYYSNVWNNIWPFLVVVLAVGAVIGLLFLLNYVLKKQNKMQKVVDSQNLANNKLNEKDNLVKDEKLNIWVKDENIKQNILVDDTQSINDQTEKTDLTNKDKKTKINLAPLKNPFFVIALILGVILWIFSVATCFLS